MALLEMISTGRMADVVRMRLRLDDLEHTVSPEVLDRFAAGAATPRERRRVVRHLLAGCSSCSRHLEQYLPMEHAEAPEGAYDQAFERSLERAFAAIAAGA